jgi:multidrug efflux system outer membrane protein
MQYTGGYTSYTTVLQAEQSLFPAELNLASMRASMLASSVNIYKAMGGGWVSEADMLTTGGTVVPVTERMNRQPVF